MKRRRGNWTMKATGKNQPERERERKIAELADLIRDTYPDISPVQAEDLARKAAKSNENLSREKIAALRAAYFRDVDELEKSGAVKIPEYKGGH